MGKDSDQLDDMAIKNVLTCKTQLIVCHQKQWSWLPLAISQLNIAFLFPHSSSSLYAVRFFDFELKQGPRNKSPLQIDDVLFQVECIYEIGVVKLMVLLLFFHSLFACWADFPSDLFIHQMRLPCWKSFLCFTQVM